MNRAQETNSTDGKRERKREVAEQMHVNPSVLSSAYRLRGGPGIVLAVRIKSLSG